MSGGFTAQKMKFSIKDFSSKCNHIRRKLRIKPLVENFIFCSSIRLKWVIWMVSFTQPVKTCSKPTAKKIRHYIDGKKKCRPKFSSTEKIFLPKFPSSLETYSVISGDLGQMNNSWQLKFCPFPNFHLRL